MDNKGEDKKEQIFTIVTVTDGLGNIVWLDEGMNIPKTKWVFKDKEF